MLRPVCFIVFRRSSRTGTVLYTETIVSWWFCRCSWFSFFNSSLFCSFKTLSDMIQTYIESMLFHFLASGPAAAMEKVEIEAAEGPLLCSEWFPPCIVFEGKARRVRVKRFRPPTNAWGDTESKEISENVDVHSEAACDSQWGVYCNRCQTLGNLGPCNRYPWSHFSKCVQLYMFMHRREGQAAFAQRSLGRMKP